MSIGFCLLKRGEEVKTKRPPLLAAFALKKWPSGFAATEHHHAQTAQRAQGERRGFRHRHRHSAKADGRIVNISLELDERRGGVAETANANRASQSVTVGALGSRRYRGP